jgi:hypothetical protein
VHGNTHYFYFGAMKKKDGSLCSKSGVQFCGSTDVGAKGIEVVDDPKGWLAVNKQSIVLSVGPDVPVRESIADMAEPPIIIWNRVESE